MPLSYEPCAFCTSPWTLHKKIAIAHPRLHQATPSPCAKVQSTPKSLRKWTYQSSWGQKNFQRQGPKEIKTLENHFKEQNWSRNAGCTLWGYCKVTNMKPVVCQARNVPSRKTCPTLSSTASFNKRSSVQQCPPMPCHWAICGVNIVPCLLSSACEADVLWSGTCSHFVHLLDVALISFMDHKYASIRASNFATTSLSMWRMCTTKRIMIKKVSKTQL